MKPNNYPSRAKLTEAMYYNNKYDSHVYTAVPKNTLPVIKAHHIAATNTPVEQPGSDKFQFHEVIDAIGGNFTKPIPHLKEAINKNGLKSILNPGDYDDDSYTWKCEQRRLLNEELKGKSGLLAGLIYFINKGHDDEGIPLHPMQNISILEMIHSNDTSFISAWQQEMKVSQSFSERSYDPDTGKHYPQNHAGSVLHKINSWVRPAAQAFIEGVKYTTTIAHNSEGIIEDEEIGLKTKKEPVERKIDTIKNLNIGAVGFFSHRLQKSESTNNHKDSVKKDSTNDTDFTMG